MKNIKKIALSLAIAIIATITFNVQAATIKEDASLFNGDVYVIGSTKFDSDFIITASRAAVAGANEALIQQNVYGNNNFKSSDIKTYYYCALDKSWSEVQENSSGLRELTTTVVSSDKIVVPATWLNGFEFTSNGILVGVKLGTIDSEGNLQENNTPTVVKQPEFILTLPEQIYAGKKFEFTLEVKANDFTGKDMTSASGNIYSEGKTGTYTLEYFNEATQMWEKINSLCEILSNPIKDQTIKYRALVKYEGNYTISASMTGIEFYNVVTSKQFTALSNPDAVAEVEGRVYEDLNDAVADNNGGTVKLLKDVALTEHLVVSNYATLDLNNKTLTLDNDKMVGVIGSANFTITNGSVVATGDYAFQVQDNATLNISNDASITAGGYGVTVWDNAIVNSEGNITVTGDGYGITGNGGYPQNTQINITNGTITATNGSALYLPQTGTTTISGGVLTGNTVIGIKAGALNITGGELIATGDKKEPVVKSNGFNYTGDVIYVEENKDYQDNISIDITGGTLTSTNGYIIQEINPTLGTANELKATITGLYSTKNATSNEQIFYYTNEAAAFTVNENGEEVNYSESSLSTIINKPAISFVSLLKDIELNNRLNISNNVVLDLNTNTIKINGDDARITAKESANVTIQNGNVIGDNYALQAQDDATLNISNDASITAGGYGVTVWDNAIVNSEGNITVTGDGYGITGNGGYPQNTQINITNGTITATNGSALYLPQTGTTTISGGVLTGNTVIGIKAGALNITGGELIATGDKKDPDPISNGFNYTGDVIYVEENKDYQDNISINITGGTLTSTNGYIIQEINPTLGTANELTATITGLYSTKNLITGTTDRFFYN